MLKFVIERFQLYRDRWRRHLAAWRWDRPSRATGPFVSRIVLVRWDAKLGDTIVLSWVLRELKRQRPDLSISMVTGPEFEEVMRDIYGIDSIFLVNRRSDWHKLKHVARELAHSRYVVHLAAIWRPRDFYFVHQLQPEHVVGLDDGLQMVDIKLGKQTQGQHFSLKLEPWLAQLGVDTGARDYWLPRTRAAGQAVDQWWPGGKVVGFCPYGASKKRQLSLQQIDFLLQTLLAEPGVAVLMIGRASDMLALKQALGDQTPQRPYVDQLIFQATDALTQLCEQVSRCKVVVCVDTAIVHIAAASQQPTLALYGDPGPESDNFKSWHPNNPEAIVHFIDFGAVEFSQAQKRDLAADCKRLLARDGL